MKGKFTFLGTGASTGIPVIGCKCCVCKSKYKKNKRLRPSAFLDINKKKFLIDVSCDFRFQALRNNICDIDGLLLTHLHFDHSGGLDDLRIFSLFKKKGIKCLLSKETYDDLKIRFPYFFSKDKGSMSVRFDFQILRKDFSKSIFEKVEIENVSYFQKKLKITGYKIGSLSYISDIKKYDEKIFSYLKGTKTLILSALREKESSSHFNIKEAILFAKKINAEKVYFTHMAHELEHKKTEKKLPKGFCLAYDGLEIEFFYGK